MRATALVHLLLAAAVLALAALATADRETAAWFGVEGPRCFLGTLLGPRACPGCGITRSTALAVHGHVADALSVNPAGVVVAVLAACAIVLNLDVLRRGAALPLHRRLRTLGGWTLLAGILVAWIVRLT